MRKYLNFITVIFLFLNIICTYPQVFEEISISLPDIVNGDIDCGDYDKDGYMDILITGDYNTQRIARIYKNNGNLSFSYVYNFSPGYINSTLAWGDFNNDEDLDFIISGKDNSDNLITRLYKGSVANTADGSGKGFGAEVFGFAYTLSGQFNNAINLDGSNDYINMPTGILKQVTDFTIAFWVRLDNLSYWSRLFDFGTGTDKNMFLTPLSGGDNFRFAITTSGGGEEQQINAAGPLSTGVWMHITITLEGNTGRLYVDGVQVGENTNITLNPSDLGITYNNYIGKSQYADDPFLDGRMDDFRIYDHALNKTEIQELAAETTSPVSKVPEIVHYDFNTVNSQKFTDMGVIMPGVSNGSVEWGDYNNDGLQDILLTGSTDGSVRISKVFKNNGDNTFTDIKARLSGLQYCSAIWGDYNNDGYPDILSIGSPVANYPLAELYRNNKDGNFSKIDIDLPDFTSGNVLWADFNSDGLLDVSVNGQIIDTDIRLLKIFLNQGNDNFYEINNNLSGTSNGSASTGDYDNDGDIDILLIGISGRDASSNLIYSTIIYKNDGKGEFSEAYFINIPGLNSAEAEFCDFNNDSMLDIIIAGTDTAYDNVTKLFINKLTVYNSKPESPLNASFDNTNLIFKWDPATDNETLPEALKYNIRIGTESGKSDIVSPLVQYNGNKLVTNVGNCGYRTNYSIDLDPGIDYYWSVQTIDNQGGVSDWTIEQQLILTGHSEVTISSTESSPTTKYDIPVTIVFTEPISGFSIDDIFVANGEVISFVETIPGLRWQIIVNPDFKGTVNIQIPQGKVINSSNIGNIKSNLLEFEYIPFSLTSADFFNESWNSIYCADVNNDGYMDVTLDGSKVFQNNSNFQFDTISGFVNIEDFNGQSGDWYDFNNDNYLDLITIGFVDASVYTRIYKNNTNMSFSDINADIIVGRRSGIWGDINYDGISEVLVSGAVQLSYSTSCPEENFNIFSYNGSDNFVDIPSSIPDVDGNTLWFDFDNDGDLDIYTSGSNCYWDQGDPDFQDRYMSFEYIQDNSYQEIKTGLKSKFKYYDIADFDNDGDKDILLSGIENIIYKNNGDLTFEEFEFNFKNNEAAVWGDFNNDGYMDIISGSIIYINDQGKNFTEIYTNLTGSGPVAWCDFDNDGDLDLFLENKIYSNNYNKVNFKPEIPANTIFNINKFEFSWDESEDVETPDSILNYNIRIGITPGGNEIIASNSLSNGVRTLNNTGNVANNLIFKYSFNTNDTYYWSVQAIDNQWEGSSWSTEQSFTIQNYTNVSLTTSEDTVDNPEFIVSVTFSDYVTDFTIDDIFIYNGTIVDLVSNTEGYTWDIIIKANAKNVSVQIPDNCIVNNNGKSNFASNQLSVVFQEFIGIIRNSYNQFSGCDGLTYGDYDNDTYLERLITEYSQGGGGTNLEDYGWFNSIGGHLKWGNINNDNYLDFIIANKYISNDVTLFISDNATTFNQSDAALTGSGKIDLGDYDNDGYLDIAFGHYVYRNNNGSEFININANINGTENPVFGDYNNDGFLDIAIDNKIFKNNNGQSFTDINAQLSGCDPLSWGDYNNDGYLDILAGRNIFKNNGDDSFTQIHTNFFEIGEVSGLWGDYNNDGFLDILLGNRIYKNNGDETFSDIYAGFEKIENGISAWGDIDNDGDLDVIIAGKNGALGSYNVYENQIMDQVIEKTVNVINLQSKLDKYTAVFTWETDTDIYNCSFNIQVGVTNYGEELVKSNTLDNNIRKISSMGNAQSARIFKLDLEKIYNHIPGDKIYWRVQPIYHNYQAGPWSSLQSLSVNAVSNFKADTVCKGDTTTFTDMSFGAFFDKWKWDFGDGSTQTIVSAENGNTKHVYAYSGNYEVTLTVYTGSVSNSTTSTIVINKSPVADFSVNPVCQGDDAQFINESKTGNVKIGYWLWDFGDGSSSNDTTNITHQYDEPDTATLYITLFNGCSDSYKKEIIVGEYPDDGIGIMDGYESKFCEGDYTMLEIKKYNSKFNYQWKEKGNNLDQNTETLKVNTEGEYSFTAVDETGYCTVNSDTQKLEVLVKPPKPVIKVLSGSTNLCPDDVVTLYVDGDIDTLTFKYDWTLNNEVYASKSNKYITGNLSAGKYKARAYSDIQCYDTSNSIIITHKPAPVKPNINVNSGPDLFYMSCTNTAAEEYFWYYNGILQPNAKKYYYFAGTQLGRYYVIIKEDYSECYVKSYEIMVPGGQVGIGDLKMENGILLFPNPANDKLNIFIEISEPIGELDIKLIDPLGRILKNIQINSNDNEYSDQIDIFALPNNVYYIVFEGKNLTDVRKVMKR